MIYRRGKKGTWWYRFRFARRIVHESARTTSKTLAREAERQRRRALAETFNGIQKRTLPPTLSQAAKVWLEKRAGLTVITRTTYEAALSHVTAKLGTRLACEVTAEHISDYQSARLAEGASGATINKEMTCIGSILGDLGHWHSIRRDVKRLPENEAGRALESAEERVLMERASAVGRNQGNWTPVYVASVLGLNTGMRKKEIRYLRWKDIDLPNRVLRVPESKTEAGKWRPIPLTQPAWAVLSYWAERFPNLQPKHFVFPACENGHLDPTRCVTNWRTAWEHATRAIQCPGCGRSQLPTEKCRNKDCRASLADLKNPLYGLRFHDLRHSLATKLLENGTPFAVVAQILGWSASTAVRMAKRYGHIRPEVQRQALEGTATAEIPVDVNQIVHQPPRAVESKLRN